MYLRARGTAGAKALRQAYLQNMLAYLQNKDEAPGLEMKEQREGGQMGRGSQSTPALWVQACDSIM